MRDDLGRRLEGPSLDKWAGEMEELHPFLTTDQRKAAYMLAFGDHPKDVAAAIEVKQGVLAQWRANLSFQELEEIVATSARMIRAGSYDSMEIQIKVLEDMVGRIQNTIDARADFHKKSQEGAHTGLLIADPKSVRVGEDEWDIVYAYRFDKAIVDSLQNLLKHIGIMRGFYSDKAPGKDKPGKGDRAGVSVIRIKHASEAPEGSN